VFAVSVVVPSPSLVVVRESDVVDCDAVGSVGALDREAVASVSVRSVEVCERPSSRD